MKNVSAAADALRVGPGRREGAAELSQPAARSEASRLGNAGFRRDYGIRLSYLSGAMYRGIASVDMVVAMGNAGLLGFFGTGGLSLERIEHAIQSIRSRIDDGRAYGMNLLHSMDRPEFECQTVEIFLKHSVRVVEAAAFMQITPALVLYRLSGASVRADGTVHAPNRIIAKISRPEVASVFMQPAPAHIVSQLREAGRLTPAEAKVASRLPVASDICVEADSAGHTDRGVASTLMPAIIGLRDELSKRQDYPHPIRVGAAGGIGTPSAAAAAFMLGADFVVTGSINQCTVEAGTSEPVKDLLQDIGVADTAYAPAGDMFELGAKIQVVRKGLFFPARANKLFELYQRFNGIHEIDAKTLAQIQERFFRRTFAEVWEETRSYYLRTDPRKIQEAETNPKQKMALIFRWYFVHSSRLALLGDRQQKVDYQVHCGPALGAFNQWVRGTALESWRNRRTAEIGELLMNETARFMRARFVAFDCADELVADARCAAEPA